MSSASVLASPVDNMITAGGGWQDTYGEAASPASFAAYKISEHTAGQVVYDRGGDTLGYIIYRTYFSFDTSILNGSVTAVASLRMTGAGDYALSGPHVTGTCGADFDVTVYRQDFTLGAAGDLNPDHATASQNWYGAYGPDASLIGVISDTSADDWEYAASKVNHFLIEVPASMIDIAGSSRFSMVSSRDVASTVPDVAGSDMDAFDFWYEFVDAAGITALYGGNANWPRLIIDYDPTDEGYSWIF